ncbi:DEAD/DEAH box helicase, partial [bacterium]|nr:DEAD/DEAH box helicase [bacterium]
IHPGPYRMGRNVEDANVYRIGHPLAQRIIEHYKKLDLEYETLEFNYTETQQKISILQNLIGQEGWLRAVCLTIDSFESEDHIILCGVTDKKITLDKDQCQRLFSCKSRISDPYHYAGQQIPKASIEEKYYAQKQQIIQESAERNASFFETEMEKLEKWADDLKSSLEMQIKELDKEIKFRKTEAKKILNLESKVDAHRKIKELEGKRKNLRMKLFEAQDDVDKRKENIIEEIEQRLKQNIHEKELFYIRWRVI